MTAVTAAPVPRETTPWRLAALLVLPLLVLSVCWAFTNPPAASPDEPDHFVKAVGNARGELGTASAEPPAGTAPVLARVASTTRTFTIPSRLDPGALTCFAFHPEITADCQDPPGPPPSRTRVASAVADYPPFLYLPIGLVAEHASSPESGIVAGRLVVTLLSSLLLLLGVSHLLRWLGRASAVGVIAVVTPMESFISASVSSSGTEFAAAVAVACVVAVAALRPETVHRPGTHAVLAIAGTVLALSRQLGVLALAGLVLVLLVCIGWRRCRELVAQHRPSAVGAVLVLGVATVTVLAWERAYDRPALVGTPFRSDAVLPFLDRTSHVLASAIGYFGWLDTAVPAPLEGAWLALWAVVLGGALLVARRRLVAVLVAVLVGTALLAFATYASAFFPVGADTQGRHFMPTFCLALVLGGAVLVRALERTSRQALVRLVWLTALVAGPVHALSLYFNGRRYAVGTGGPLLFVPDAVWSPVLGWTPWLVLTALSCVALSVAVVRLGVTGVPEPALDPLEAAPGKTTAPGVVGHRPGARRRVRPRGVAQRTPLE